MTAPKPKQSKQFASLPADITIWAMASQPSTGSLWLCTNQGLYQAQESSVEQHLQGAPCQSVIALGKTILASGHPNQVIYSPDNGKTWFPSRIELPGAPVTCFAASPNFARDATLLAGSDGDGILRSTNGGNAWQPSNFGLRSRNILAFAWAQSSQPETEDWSASRHIQIVFAASEDGVYRSPNAGRAWQSCSQGLPQNAVLSLAVSPDFGKIMTSRTQSEYRGALFAGTDGSGLYASLNGGENWQRIDQIAENAIINDLRFDSSGHLLAAIAGQGILASPDLGQTWQPVMESEEIILCLEEQDSQLLAGSAENGLWILDT
jgi:photosystem II stability/assembly factor-like uncharacterized protein